MQHNFTRLCHPLLVFVATFVSPSYSFSLTMGKQWICWLPLFVGLQPIYFEYNVLPTMMGNGELRSTQRQTHENPYIVLFEFPSYYISVVIIEYYDARLTESGSTQNLG